MYYIIQDDYPSPGWDLILQRVLKIRSFPRRMAVNLPLFEQSVSTETPMVLVIFLSSEAQQSMGLVDLDNLTDPTQQALTNTS